MKKLLILLIPNIVFAFTLSSEDPIRYDPSDVTIRPTGNDCTDAGFSQSDLRSYIEQAIDLYWNSVPTSSLKFSLGDNISIPAGTLIDDMYANNLIPANSIVVGCSTENTQDFTSLSTLGLGALGAISGQAAGVAMLNNVAGTLLAEQDESQIIAVIAHEIGHAFGLSHVQEYKYALMYYSTGVAIREDITQDDADGITYLYPQEKEAGGLFGACGSIDLDPPASGGPISLALSLCLGFLATLLAPRFAKRGLNSASIV